MTILNYRSNNSWQVLSGATPTILIPDPPTNLYGDSPSSGNIRIFWTPPAYLGHGALTNYIVTATKVSDSSTSTQTVSIPAEGKLPTGATFSGLTVGSSYTFTAKSRNAAGDSVASASSAAIVVSNITALPALETSAHNARYFCDVTTKDIIFLGGSHTWGNLIDNGVGDPLPSYYIFDYTAWINFVQARGHNFFRLWRWEQVKWSNQFPDPEYYHDPSMYQRTGPGTALDGKPKFDLTKFNQAYFDRMRARVIQAGAAGLYPAIMLFNGWSVGFKGDYRDHQPWDGHPMNTLNNINGLVVPVDVDGSGFASQTDTLPAVNAYQFAYLEKVIDTVGDLTNVTYEITNESLASSVQWQYDMINKLHEYEDVQLGGHHPVLMSTTNGGGGGIDDLYTSPAEMISFGANDIENQSATAGFGDGTNIQPRVSDTDHICGSCNGSLNWVWTSFVRGYYMLIMDVYDARSVGDGVREYDNTIDFDVPRDFTVDNVRFNIGKVIQYAARMDLKVALPQDAKSSTTFAMVKSGTANDQYLVFTKVSGAFTVDLSASTGTFTVEWFDPQSCNKDLPNGTTYTGLPDVAAGGAATSFTAPFSGAAVLFLTQ